MTTGPRLQDAIAQIERARAYTLHLIADIDDAEWFEMPHGAPTHVGWQLGHLAMAEYAVCLARRRGTQPEDRELMSRPFRKQFAKGSAPSASAGDYPTPPEIRQTLDAVHARSLMELASEREDRLTQPLAAPHEMFQTLLEALQFAAAHEMLHAGQIGMLRRLLGKDPVR